MTSLLLASTGGHLAQLHQLRRRLLPEDEPVVWCTFDTPQSRSLLADERVEYVPYVAPRDWKQVTANARLAHGILQRHKPIQLITTGSGIALSFLPVARARGIHCRYIESAARSDGPSVTGRFAGRIPGVETFTQYDSWASDKWLRAPSVFDDFQPTGHEHEGASIGSVVVTLGTIEGYGFRSLLERLLGILPPDVPVLWQTGETEVDGLPIDARPVMPQAELQAAIGAADVVVAHAGIGSALGALHLGKRPVLVPRRHHRGEHVDDHQVQIARELAGRDLAIHKEVEQLGMEDLLRAARRGVHRLD